MFRLLHKAQESVANKTPSSGMNSHTEDEPHCTTQSVAMKFIERERN